MKTGTIIPTLALTPRNASVESDLSQTHHILRVLFLDTYIYTYLNVRPYWKAMVFDDTTCCDNVLDDRTKGPHIM